MERLYKNMTVSGAMGIVGGICAIAIGVFIIVAGGLMLRNRKKILF